MQYHDIVWRLPPDGPAAAVEAVEEHGEAASAERQQSAAGSDAPEEQVAGCPIHAQSHRAWVGLMPPSLGTK